MTYFKNKSIWFWGFILLLLINVSILGSLMYVMQRIHHQPDYNGFHRHFVPKKKVQKQTKKNGFVKELNMNPQQSKALKKIRQVHFKEMKRLKNELKEKQYELFIEASKDTPDNLIIIQLKKENMNLNEQIMDESLEFFKRMQQNLTPDQMEIMKNHYTRKFNNNTHKRK